jgi:DNA-binding beta-propeller fold protein YncE
MLSQTSLETSCVALLVFAASAAQSQALPNPYRLVDGWAQLPDGREIGAVGDVIIDPDGRHIWAVIRCDAGPELFGWECLESNLDPIIKFDPERNVVESFGGGMFIWPHGIDVDNDGNVWVTDAASPERTDETRGHQVIKFSPTGDVLMVLGTPGEMGAEVDHLNSPADVVVADNGDVFVADGHAADGNNRVMKFSGEGRFIKAWGQTGYGPGEFRTLHTIAIDRLGRVFVGDRTNNESDDVQNPGWEMGIRIGDALTGWVDEFILYQWGDPRETAGNGAEFVAIDAAGNLYGGEPRPRNLQKYVRVRP